MANTLYFFLTFVFLFASTSVCSSENFTLKIPMEEFLQKRGHTVHFSNPVFYVELASGQHAVLKMAEPYWLKPSIAEVAAYKASQFLHLDLVPRTTLFVKGKAIGSLQQYVEPSFDLMKKEHYENAIKKASPTDLANIALFYFVFGQWDLGPSNLIATKVGNHIRLHLIDNGAMGSMQKVQYGKHPFVHCFPEVTFPASDQGESFPFANAKTLPPTPAIWEKELGSFLSAGQIKQLCRLGKPITFVLWKGRFYRQYGFGKPAYTSVYPKKTMQRLKRLTLDRVKRFFQNDVGCTYSDEFFKDIIDRRDQVLTAYRQIHKNSL